MDVRRAVARPMARLAVALAVGTLAAAVLGTAPSAAAQTARPEPATTTVTASIPTTCTDILFPIADPTNPEIVGVADTSTTVTATVPTQVEQGQSFAVTVSQIVGGTHPIFPYNFTLDGSGVSPNEVPLVTSGATTPEFGPVTFVATGAPGTSASLTLPTFSWTAPTPGGLANESCATFSGEDTVATIPIVAPTCFGEPATIVGLPDQPTVTGTAADDVIVAWSANATIDGEGGADRICDRAGDGTLSFADSPNRAVAVIAFGAATDPRGMIRFEGIENLTGSAHNDFLVGDAKANVIHGGDGNDVLVGLGGADTLDGGTGHNLVVP